MATRAQTFSGLAGALSKAFGGRVSVCIGKTCYPRQYGAATRRKKGVKVGKRTYYTKVGKKKAGPGTSAQKRARANMRAASKACAGQPQKAFRMCVKDALRGRKK